MRSEGSPPEANTLPAAGSPEAGLKVATASRLLLVGRNRLLQDCLAQRLRQVPWLGEVEWAVDLGEAVERAEASAMDLVFVDLEELTDGHLQGLQQLHGRRPEAPIVVRGCQSKEGLAAGLPEGVTAGVRGYLCRDASWQDLLSTLGRVLGRDSSCDPLSARTLFQRLNDLGRESRKEEEREALDLTARQLAILRLLAEGLSNQGISDRLGISLSTVKSHVHKVLRRLGARDRTEAVSVAFRKNWL